MDLSRLRSLLAAPMASLFLILCLCAFAGRQPASQGVWLPVMRVRVEAPLSLCDPVSMNLRADGSIWVRSFQIPSGQLNPWMQKIMLYRAERTVYLTVEDGVTVQQANDFMARLANSTPGWGLNIALVPRISRELPSELGGGERRINGCDLIPPSSAGSQN